MKSILPVILSGGSGTRLWPASRSMYPKQLLPLVDGVTTMLQQTAQRLNCNEDHRFLVAEQLRAIDKSSQIVLEPQGRNTAPAVALAAFLAAEKNPDTLLLVMPADHVIEDTQAFQAAVNCGREVAADGKLVTFGIVPTRPETGYGYVQARRRHRNISMVASTSGTAASSCSQQVPTWTRSVNSRRRCTRPARKALRTGRMANLFVRMRRHS
jgi:mannose-1-phosphate guanylyltransferase/mannose-6-phosphate isomerase